MYIYLSIYLSICIYIYIYIYIYKHIYIYTKSCNETTRQQNFSVACPCCLLISSKNVSLGLLSALACGDKIVFYKTWCHGCRTNKKMVLNNIVLLCSVWEKINFFIFVWKMLCIQNREDLWVKESTHSQVFHRVVKLVLY